MSGFHPPIYCDNQDDFIFINNWSSSLISSGGDYNVYKSNEETKKAEILCIKLPEPKRGRTIEDIKKFDTIMRDFEKMLKNRDRRLKRK